MADDRWLGDVDTFAADRGPDTNTLDEPAGASSSNGWDTDVSDWGERTPSGRRHRVDTQAAAQRSARAPHVQQLSKDDAYYGRTFTSAQFVAYLKDGGKFNKNGDMELTVVVPFEFKHLAIPMSDGVGLPLSIDVQVWAPYRYAQLGPDDDNSTDET